MPYRRGKKLLESHTSALWLSQSHTHTDTHIHTYTNTHTHTDTQTHRHRHTLTLLVPPQSSSLHINSPSFYTVIERVHMWTGKERCNDVMMEGGGRQRDVMM